MPGKAQQSTDKRRPSLFGGRRGAALVLVLLLLAILTVLLAEFQFNLRVQTFLYHNQEAEVRARYVAKAGVNAAQGLMLNASLENDAMFNNEMVQLYRYECMVQPAGLGLGAGLDGAEVEIPTDAGGGQQAPSPSDGSTDFAGMENCGSWSFALPYGMDDMALDMEIYDEQARLNLNALYQVTEKDGEIELKTDQDMKYALTELFALQIVRHNIELEVPLDELIEAIMDYMDFGTVDGSFDKDLNSYFEYEDDKDRIVPMKDGFYDTVDELKVIPWMTDELFDAVKDYLTVYPMLVDKRTFNKRVNMNTASVEVIYSIIRGTSYQNEEPQISPEDAMKQATAIVQSSLGQTQTANTGTSLPLPASAAGVTGTMPKYVRTIDPTLKSNARFNQFMLLNPAQTSPRYYRIVSTAYTEDALDTVITKVVRREGSSLITLYYRER